MKCFKVSEFKTFKDKSVLSYMLKYFQSSFEICSPIIAVRTVIFQCSAAVGKLNYMFEFLLSGVCTKEDWNCLLNSVEAFATDGLYLFCPALFHLKVI